jgi:two-component system KDP operon response regulator KdpE
MKKNTERDSSGALLRVLVVEADRSVLRMLRFSLQVAGFEITEARTGAEALTLLSQRLQEAVILDLGLPDGRSGAALTQLRQLDRSSDHPPAWVVTSALDQEEATRQFGPLYRRFIPKPYDPWALISSLESQLAHRHKLPS